MPHGGKTQRVKVSPPCAATARGCMERPLRFLKMHRLSGIPGNACCCTHRHGLAPPQPTAEGSFGAVEGSRKPLPWWLVNRSSNCRDRDKLVPGRTGSFLQESNSAPTGPDGFFCGEQNNPQRNRYEDALKQNPDKKPLPARAPRHCRAFAPIAYQQLEPKPSMCKPLGQRYGAALQKSITAPHSLGALLIAAG